jgi:hypothetical protein
MKPLVAMLSFTHASLFLLAAISLTGCDAGPLEPGEDFEPDEISTATQPLTYDGHDYLIVTTRKNWQEARFYCAGAGYYLATIDSAAEEAFLNDQQGRKGLVNWWIGYSDTVTEGWWTWIGTQSSTFYSNWAPGEPNNDGNQDCAIDRYNGTDQWDDEYCSKSNPFICERDSVPTANTGSYNYSASNTSNATANTFNYFVYVPAGRVLTVGSCGVAGASATGDTYLRINNPSGQEIASNDDAGASCGLGSNISIVTPVSGTYIIRSGCFSSGSCSGTVAYIF